MKFNLKQDSSFEIQSSNGKNLLEAKEASGSALMQEITWSELKDLRDSSQLIQGQFYRITDYTCTTITTNTSSAGHVFDIIVLALERNKLSEEASAIQHDGDTYFSNSKLESWQIWYCLDNDTNRFAWANITNGKGVIYRMIDEFSNDIPYDFKNILFTKTDLYTNAYTFSCIEDSIIKDASLSGINKACHSNIIKPYYSGILRLHFNVFYTTSNVLSCYGNLLKNNCGNNTFGYGCYNNTLGNRCSSNKFKEDVSNNTFGNEFSSNTFEGEARSNIIGNYCNDNTFAASFNDNVFGNSCNGNTFGPTSISNVLGNSCYDNTFGDHCQHNNFGNYFQRNFVGSTCCYNLFGNYCYNNHLGYSCQNNTFGNSCGSNKCGSYCESNTFGNDCYNIIFGTSDSTISRCKYNIVDSGCYDIYINSEDENGDLHYIHIHFGVKGTSDNYKTITINRGLSYTIDVYPVGSTEMFI